MVESRSRPRVLLTGGSGLLATNWACAMRSGWDVVLATHSRRVQLDGVDTTPLRLESVDAVDAALRAWRPDLLVHTAGLTDVDRCEADFAAAQAINVDLAGVVATAAASARVPLVHISTDHLFSGQDALVTEETPPAPLNEYARSKWRAEEVVTRAHATALIVRTNFFGWGHRTRRSFTDWILATLDAGQTVSAFDDVFFTPALADAVAEDVLALVGHGAHGVFHVCGDERLSKYAFAMRVATNFGRSSAQIRPVSIADAGLRAPRPLDMSLSTARLRATIGRAVRPVDDELHRLASQEAQGRRALLMEAVL